jgi:hypothetical protein
MGANCADAADDKASVATSAVNVFRKAQKELRIRSHLSGVSHCEIIDIRSAGKSKRTARARLRAGACGATS